MNADQIDAAVEELRSGGVIGLPTETVYGLAADASNERAVQRIFEIKGRPAGHPLIVHTASASAALNDWAAGENRWGEQLAEAFWPGPLTLIVESSGRAAPAVTGGRFTVGVRVPDHPVALEVLRRFDGGVAAPSANRFGLVSPTTAAHVRADLGNAVAVVLDGGSSAVGVESTIIELTGPGPVLLRPGAISVEAIEAVLGGAVVDGRAGESRAAGMMASHYTPVAPVRVVASIDETLEPGAAVIAPKGTMVVGSGADAVQWLPADPAGYAEGLYAALRLADRPGVAAIVVLPPTEPGPMLPAIMDRLAKASAPR